MDHSSSEENPPARPETPKHKTQNNINTDVATKKNSTQNKQKTAEDTSEDDKHKIPPIIITKKETWDRLAEYFDNHNISWLRVKNINLGIKVFLNDTFSYREATKYLENQKIPYYTFTPPEEKTLRVVIRGVPEHYSEDDIKANLESQGHKPIKIARMKNHDKKLLPLVLAILPREETNIYQLKYVKRFSIIVEPQKPKATIGQCHRCQQFGHAQSRCTAPPKCVKCAGNHITSECHKPANVPAKCTNCGGPHPASYKGCSKYPKRSDQPARKVTQELRYADAAISGTSTKQNSMDALNAVKAIQNLLQQVTQIDKQITPNQTS